MDIIRIYVNVNKDILVENLEEESLIAQRVAYDSVKLAGEPLGVSITPDMVKSVRSASGRYREMLTSKKSQEAKDTSNREQMKRAAKEQLASLQAKKQALRVDSTAQEAELQRQIDAIRRKGKN